MKREWLLCGLLCAAAALLLPLISISDFRHDDDTHLRQNAALQNVNSWKDVWKFRIQSSRPISNWVVALVQWWGKGSMEAQRALSLALHLLNCVLLFLLVGGRQRMIAAFLALHPIAVHLVGVAVFRWELLGTFFVLTALYALRAYHRNSNSRWMVLVFVSIAAAQFSKETFGPLATLACLLYLEKEHSRWRIPLVVFQLGLAVAVGYLLTLPSPFPYKSIIGIGVMDFTTYLRIAAISTLEAITKFLGVSAFTYTRVFDRLPPAQSWSALTSALALIVTYAGGSALLWRHAISRPYTLSALAGLAAYNFVPNLNMGYGHYFYVSFALFLLGLGHALPDLLIRIQPRLRRVLQLTFFFYLGCLSFKTYSRREEFRQIETYLIADVEAYPQYQAPYTYLIEYLRDTKGIAATQPFLAEARRRFPKEPVFIYSDLLFQLEKENFAAAKLLEDEVRQSAAFDQAAKGAVLASYARSCARKGWCQKALKLFDEAYFLNPQEPDVTQARSQLSQLTQQHPERCLD